MLISRHEIVLLSNRERRSSNLKHSLILRLVVHNIFHSLRILLEVKLVVDPAALQHDTLSFVETGITQSLVLLLEVVDKEVDVRIQRNIIDSLISIAEIGVNIHL